MIFLLQLIHVKKRYKGRIIFEDVNIKFPSKGLLFLKGPSGRGKSTLLNVIYGLEKCDGRVIKKGNIGYMSQEESLDDSKSVYDNLKYFGNCDAYIKDLGLENVKYNLVGKLSLGEKRRVEFIATIMKKRDIYLLDEPFANLDNVNKHKMLNIIKSLSVDSLFIVATHDLLEECDDYIEICDSKVVCKCNKDLNNKWKYTGKSYLYDFVNMNKIKILNRNFVCCILVVVSVLLSLCIKNVCYSSGVDFGVYVYKEGEDFLTPTQDQLSSYLNDDSDVRGFIEPDIMSNMVLYSGGSVVDDYDIVLCRDEFVSVNDVFYALYNSDVLYISIKGDYKEESVNCVVNDLFIRPTVYLSYEKYKEYADYYIGVIITNPNDGDGTLVNINAYPSVNDYLNKSVKRMNYWSKVSVIVCTFSLWVIVAILMYEHNKKLYRNLRLNVSLRGFVWYMLIERIFMFWLTFLLPMKLLWLILLSCEFLVSYMVLSSKMKEIKKQ